MTKEELVSIRQAAWSIREESHVGEFLGSVWDEMCQDTFHYYRNTDDPTLFWYDTDSNRLMNRQMRDAARRRTTRDRDEKVNRREESGRVLSVREDGIFGETPHLPRNSKQKNLGEIRPDSPPVSGMPSRNEGSTRPEL